MPDNFKKGQNMANDKNDKKVWKLQGKELQKTREKYSCFNQNFLSKKLDISRSLLSLIESGERKASYEILLKFSKVLQLSHYEKKRLFIIYENYEEAIIRPMNRENSILFIKLVKDLKVSGFLKQSKALAQIGIDIFTNSSELFVLLANISLIDREYEQAKEQTLSALKLHNNKSLISIGEIYHNLGNICLNLGLQFELERNKFIIEKEKLLILRNESPQFENKIKDLNLKMLKLYKEGEEYLIKAEEQEPEHEHIIETCARLFYNISKVSGDDSYLHKSIEYFTKFITSDKCEFNNFTN